MSDTRLNKSINIFIKLLKGTVNDKKFSYDDDGLDNAINYAVKLMREKKPVNFEWHHDYEKGYQNKPIQKIDPAAGALAGWWFGQTIDEINRERGRLSPSQQREFDRQIDAAMTRGRFSKSILLEKLQQLSKNNSIMKVTARINPATTSPPRKGEVFDPVSHRWVKPETKAKGAIAARKGKKRIRGTGTGIGEKKVAGHGKGITRFVGAGRKVKGRTDVTYTPTKAKKPRK
jgi:hypothetical protein